MPCTDEGRQTTQSEQDAWDKLERGYTDAELEDAFCSICRAVLEAGHELPVGAKKVWAAHEKRDAKRIKVENADAERRRLKKSGLSKLTARECDALGLRGEETDKEWLDNYKAQNAEARFNPTL